MSQLRERLEALARSLGVNRALLGRARRRTKTFRERAEANEAKQTKAQEKADGFRLARAAVKAERQDRIAARCEHRAARSRAKEAYWRGKVKVRLQRVRGLKVKQAALEAELAAELKKHKVTIKGNKATGGTAGQRWRAVCKASVANCASGRRRNFYSMSGAWDIDSVIVPGEEYGQRSDCSSTVTGWALAAGLPDPNGADWSGGYTGTLVGEHNGWRQVSRPAMVKKGWGYVVYGGGVGYHVEAYIGPDDRTAGHGSAPVDFGVIDLFGDGDYRCFIYDPK